MLYIGHTYILYVISYSVVCCAVVTIASSLANQVASIVLINQVTLSGLPLDVVSICLA